MPKQNSGKPKKKRDTWEKIYADARTFVKALGPLFWLSFLGSSGIHIIQRRLREQHMQAFMDQFGDPFIPNVAPAIIIPPQHQEGR